MKKLITLYETVSKVNTALYSNLLFPTGITPGASPRTDSIDENLLKDINAAAKAAGLKVSITTAVSGHKETTKSGNTSRHSTGNAVDIAMINGVAINKETGDKLVAELKKMGYNTSGNESGKDKVILWQVADHFNHIHVSNNSGISSSSNVGTSGTETTSTDTSVTTPTTSNTADDEYATITQNILRGFVEPIADKIVNPLQNEHISSKEKRLIRDIEKIKKLL